MKSSTFLLILACLLMGGSTLAAGSTFAGADSDSSYLALKLSSSKILLQDVVNISGNSIRYGNFKTVAMTITGPSTSVTKSLPLSDSGAFKTSWQAAVPGNNKITVKVC